MNRSVATRPKIPGDQLEISGYLVMQETVQEQLRELLQHAARTSGAAPKGSPAQQVGDFYASGMDVERLNPNDRVTIW